MIPIKAMLQALNRRKKGKRLFYYVIIDLPRQPDLSRHGPLIILLFGAATGRPRPVPFTTDLCSALFQVDISDALCEQDKVKFTVQTRISERGAEEAKTCKTTR